MLGFNGGLIGKTRTTSLTQGGGLWTPNTHILRQRDVQWPLSGNIAIVTGTAAPVLGAGATASAPAEWTVNYDSSTDDGFVLINNWPVTFTLNSVAYTSGYFSANSYITFGSGTTAFQSFSSSNPALPKILLGPFDTSIGKIFSLSGMSADSTPYFKVRYQSGNAGTIVETTFFAPRTNGEQWVEVRVGSHGNTAAPIMIANSTTSYASSTISANSSWVFVGDSTGTSWTLTSNRYVG